MTVVNTQLKGCPKNKELSCPYTSLKHGQGSPAIVESVIDRAPGTADSYAAVALRTSSHLSV